MCLKEALLFNTYKLAKKWNCLIIENKNNNTKKITENVLNRKKNDPLLLIAPGGAEGMNQEKEYELCEFRTGAFVSKSPVLPILISYKPYIYFNNNIDKLKYILNLINREKIYYKITILDPIYPEENDTIESFKDRVYNIMNNKKKKIIIKEEEIYVKQNNSMLVNIIIFLLILSYIIFTKNIKENILLILVTVICFIIYIKNNHYIYDYVYKNIVYIYGIGLSIYSLCNENYLLFINSLIYPFVYKILNNKFN